MIKNIIRETRMIKEETEEKKLQRSTEKKRENICREKKKIIQ